MTRKAFTLIELLVVLAIIALVIAILIPCLAAPRDHSRSVNCKNNLRQLGFITRLYCNDYKMLPLASFRPVNEQFDCWGDDTNAGVWHCPSDSKPSVSTVSPFNSDSPTRDGKRLSYNYFPGSAICPDPSGPAYAQSARKLLTQYENTRLTVVLMDDSNRHKFTPKGVTANAQGAKGAVMGTHVVNIEGQPDWLNAKAIIGLGNAQTD
jgi:prepilin-type N-terminal cleavage/methylation domain-containing protein